VPCTPFSTLRRWLVAAPARTARGSRLRLVSLEDRAVPTVVVSFTSGQLHVIGDGLNNVLDVRTVGTAVKVFETDMTGEHELSVSGGPVTLANLQSILVDANDGNDTISISKSIKKPATMNGGTGSDNLVGGGGNDTIDLTDDTIGDTADGGDGNDTITSGAGSDLVSGGKGNDTINAGDGVNFISGGDGNDILSGGSDIDDITGGNGNDLINGGGGNDRLRGDDTAAKTPGNDTINGGDGDDIISGGAKNDVIDGGAGSDKIEGGSGNDTITGGPEVAGLGDADADSVFGGIGNDIIKGGGGDDLLYGEAGMDIITGGAGSDLLSGGLNRDILVGHGAAAPGPGTAVSDFDTYKDEFDLTRPIFGKAEPKDVAVTELGIQDALAGLAAVASKQGEFNVASRIRYLGSGEYLVKLGRPDDISEVPSNPNPFGWVPVSFDGTWTDNDPRPSAGERFLAPTVATEQREFWTILVYRAVAQMMVPGYDPFVWTASVDPALTNTGDVIDTMTGHSPTEYVIVGAPPANFGFSDIQADLAAGVWVTAKTSVAATLPGLAQNQGYAITKAFVSGGVSYFTLYNPSGRDRAVSPGAPLDEVGVPKDDGFITITADEFYANFATGWVN